MGLVAFQQDCQPVLAYLGLGANLGDRAGQLGLALQLLRADAGIRVTKVSSLFHNPALTHPKSSPWYLNAVCQIETNYAPHQLLDQVKAIERKMGRRLSVRWADRVIDIDILFYGDEVLDMPNLKIPHPELARRLFVLKPLSEIAPQLVHPATGKTVGQLYEALW